MIPRQLTDKDSVWIVDIETRSICDLQKCGAWEYARHPSTVPILIYIQKWSPDPKKCGVPLLWTAENVIKIPNNSLICGFNVFFDYQVLKEKRPSFFPESYHMVDVQALAAYFGYSHSLKEATKDLNLGKKLKDEGKRLINKYCKPRGYNREFLPLDWASFITYCKQDVILTGKLLRALNYSPMPADYAFYKAIWRCNERGFMVNRVLCMNIRECFEKFKVSALKYAIKKYGFSPTQTKKVSQYLNLPDAQRRNLIDRLEVEKDENKKILIQLRLILSNTSLKKTDSLLNFSKTDGKVHGVLIYHGAHTGRLSAKGVQVQNFPRDKVDRVSQHLIILREYNLFWKKNKEKGVAILRGLLRSVIQDRSSLFVGDFDQVEWRIICWLSNSSGMYEKDPYTAMANLVGRPNDRQLGKTIVLGCMFGMGSKLFHQVANKGSSQNKVSMIEAVTYHRAFNQKYSNITEYRYALHHAIMLSLRKNISITLGKLTIRPKAIFLPSGRVLNMPHMRITPEGKLSIRDVTIYSSKLIENAVQAIAADLLRDCWLYLEKNDYQILFSVHDEIVALSQKCQKISEYNKLMQAQPQWSKGLVYSASSQEVDFYQKI